MMSPQQSLLADRPELEGAGEREMGNVIVWMTLILYCDFWELGIAILDEWSDLLMMTESTARA